MARSNPLRLNVNIGLGVAFAVLLVTSSLAAFAAAASGRAAERREASYLRRVELVGLTAALRQVEATARAYLLISNDDGLARYESARRISDLQLQRSAASLHEELHHQALVGDVERLASARIALMDSIVTQHRGGRLTAAREQSASDRGQAVMDTIQVRISELTLAEGAELAVLESQWRSAQRRSVVVAVGTSVLTLLFLIASAWVINRDITKRLAAEARVRSNEHALFQILEAVPVGLFVVDAIDQKPLFANRRSEEILGIDLAKVPLPRLAAEVKSLRAGTDEPYPTERSPIRLALAGETVHAEDIEIDRNGRHIPVEVWASPIFDERQNVRYAISAFSDITERKESENEVRHLANELSDFYENAPYGYYSLDAGGAFVRINRTLVNWLGYRRDDMLKMRITDVLSDTSREAFEKDFPRVKLTGMLINRDYEMTRRDGSVLPVMISSTAVRDADGSFLRTRSSVVDLTERRRAEAAERKAREVAEASNRAKSEFLARMSHELRTPLNSIIGFSEVLEDQTLGRLTSKQLRYVQNVLTSGRHLLGLVNDVLDLSRIEAGRMELVTGTVVVSQVLAEVLAELEPQAARKGLAISMAIAPEIGSITADEARVRQVVRNLLANAVKYTREGGRIAVSARTAEGPTGARDWLEIAFSDTGIGIKPEDQQRIFGEFEQAGNTYVQQQEGSGLGLAVSRRLIDLHGGTISVESTPDKGSTFTLRLPMKGPDWQKLPSLDARPRSRAAGGRS